MLPKSLVILPLSILFGVGFSHGQDDEARMLAEVRGVLAHHCYKCHASDKQKGKLRLDTKEGIFNGGESGAIVVPGKPEQSEILRRVLLPADHDDAMPKKGDRLEADQTDLLRKWIAAGAPWPDDQAGTFRRAPLALTKPAIPELDPAPVNPIDAFVGRYFADADVKWPKPASDAAYARRVYLDIIGLLPAYRDVARYDRDKNPDKHTQLVASLLERNNDYAQHWMTFWNDALRNDYAGTGYIDGGRTQISDWLYLALARNMPYDQFVRELISPVAGSSGFINGINWRGAVNASQIREMQAAQSLSQVFLGLNLKCASCHDSFINDWKLADSYALANVFANEPLEIHRCDQATGKSAETRFLFPELGNVPSDVSREERMKQLAALVTSKANGRLPRTIVNRLWARFLGRGLVEPVDEMDGLPWNEALLDWLAADFVENDYDVKHTIARILSSRAYRLSSVAVDDPNRLTSQDFAFRGPVRKRLSAEQFADAVSQLVQPLFEKSDYMPPARQLVVVPEAPEALQRAKWVWRPGDEGLTAATPGTVRFSKSVKPHSTRRLLKGEAFLAADNAFELFINGEAAGRGDGWESLHYVDFSEHLKGSKTTVGVTVSNTGEEKSPAGLVGVIQMTYLNSESKEERLLVPTYNAWRIVPEAEDGVLIRSEELAVFGEGPWKNVGKAVPMDTGYPGDFVRAVSVKNHPFLRALGRPVRDTVTTNRITQATLLEALELTNGAFLKEKLSYGANTVAERGRNRSAGIVRRVYRDFLGRNPTDDEVAVMEKELGRPDTTPQKVEDFLWAILVSPEFQIVY
jgi:mono/diheme cytochrome c family protein